MKIPFTNIHIHVTLKSAAQLAAQAALTEAQKAVAALQGNADLVAAVRSIIDELGSTADAGIVKLEKAALLAIPLITSAAGVEVTKDFAIEFVQTVYNDAKAEVRTVVQKILAILGIK